MSRYNFIIDVNSGKEYSIFSNHGRSLLKSYVQLYKSGGKKQDYTRISDSSEDETMDLVGHMFRCKTTTDGTTCKHLPPLLLKEHRYDSDKENINTTDKDIVVLQEVGTDEYRLVKRDEDPYGPNNDLRTKIYLKLTKDTPTELEDALKDADAKIARGDKNTNDASVSKITLLPNTSVNATEAAMAGKEDAVRKDAVSSPVSPKKSNSLLNFLKNPFKRTKVKRTEAVRDEDRDYTVDEAIELGKKAIEDKKAELAKYKQELKENTEKIEAANRLINGRYKNSTKPTQKKVIEGKIKLIPVLEARNKHLTTLIENLEGDLDVSTTMPSNSDLERELKDLSD